MENRSIVASGRGVGEGYDYKEVTEGISGCV